MKGNVDFGMGPGSVGFLYRFTGKGNRATYSVTTDPRVKGGEPFGVARVGKSLGWNEYRLEKLSGDEEKEALDRIVEENERRGL